MVVPAPSAVLELLKPLTWFAFGCGVVASAAWRWGLYIGEPRRKAPWYNATGTTLYVLGMLVAAFGLRTLASSVS